MTYDSDYHDDLMKGWLMLADIYNASECFFPLLQGHAVHQGVIAWLWRQAGNMTWRKNCVAAC